MQNWLMDVAIGIGIFFVVWWVESRTQEVLRELRSIRMSLERLWAEADKNGADESRTRSAAR